MFFGVDQTWSLQNSEGDDDDDDDDDVIIAQFHATLLSLTGLAASNFNKATRKTGGIP